MLLVFHSFSFFSKLRSPLHVPWFEITQVKILYKKKILLILYCVYQVIESEGYLEMSLGDVIEILQSLPSSVLGQRDTTRAIRAWVQHRDTHRIKYASQVCNNIVIETHIGSNILHRYTNLSYEHL